MIWLGAGKKRYSYLHLTPRYRVGVSKHIAIRELLWTPSPKVFAAYRVCQECALCKNAACGAQSSMSRNLMSQRGKLAHSRGWMALLQVLNSVLQATKDVCPGTTPTQSLLGENPTVNLPQMKREGLWSVTLNADKRAIETKGRTSSSAFNALFKNLEMCCLSLQWVLQVLLIFFHAAELSEVEFAVILQLILSLMCQQYTIVF